MLVVIGHFLLPMERTRFVGSLIHIIYLFHMPMFALISGYFAKSVYLSLIHISEPTRL